MLENTLQTGVNATLFKNEKIADQALFPPPQLQLLLWESGYVTIPGLQPLKCWTEVP